MRNIDFAFPAGYESDASNDDWDIEPEGKPSDIKDLGFPVVNGGDNDFVLKKAVSDGDINTVQQLLDNGMDVETKLSYGWTPLMCAVSLANYNLAKLLLDRGASANFSKDHWTVLMASCSASASEDKIVHCVELLLSRSADPNMVDRSQITCLMMAAREGYSKLVNLLVSHGAAINTQDSKGYTALAIAVQYGREEVVLKLLQLGADKTIRTKNGKSPADLARMFQHRRIMQIFASSSQLSTFPASTSIEDTLSELCRKNPDDPSYKESATKLDEVQLLLHGLNLGHLADIMTENDISWSYLMTMEKEDLKKIGITDPEDQQKVLSAVQQMQLNKVDLDKIQLVIEENGNEELLNFLLSVSHQCSYLTEILQDTSSRFPRQTSQLILSMDPKKEAQSVCSQLVLQTKDLQKEVTCLYSLLCQMDAARDCSQLPQPGSHQIWRTWAVTGAALGVLGAAFFLLHFKASRAA
ncbi:PREDICTED: ankyrin repeat, SAM and basic leucine zipper domain-containing protein 1 [Cyprinodon variegatus]|uniref:ankyrin repeat, SAM and basic leucine zipper domain-containing protein 1 n=1 Tax=Cyprinodon variegatus TaxID=28743 RepID=UPI00074295F3|nr:PREDICTED: ankyrin repeat, SAM and basic leucine zipper domain-containing protein 1 [Cyprinodon variegatus]